MGLPMTSKTQIVHGGSNPTRDDLLLLQSLAKHNKIDWWSCGKKTKIGDRLLIYLSKAVKRYFERQGYKVVSCERQNLGYDFNVSRNGEMLHVEVKGVSGLVSKFIITAGEVKCARTDSKFRLVVVTEATVPKRKIELFTPKEFLKFFKLKTIAYFAEDKRG